MDLTVIGSTVVGAIFGAFIGKTIKSKINNETVRKLSSKHYPNIVKDPELHTIIYDIYMTCKGLEINFDPLIRNCDKFNALNFTVDECKKGDPLLYEYEQKKQSYFLELANEISFIKDRLMEIRGAREDTDLNLKLILEKIDRLINVMKNRSYNLSMTIKQKIERI